MATKKNTADTDAEMENKMSTEEVMDSIEYLAEHRQEHKLMMQESLRLSRELSEPFPKEVERILRKGGTELTYIPISEVIVRLNKVFGVAGWSSEIVRCERDPLDPDFIIAHVRLAVLHNGVGTTYQRIIKDGFGGQRIKRTKQGDIVDLGDEFKGAVSDALKKAAQQFGIGLYLARTDEAMMIEEEQEHAAAMAAIDPTVRALWDQFINVSKGLDTAQKATLGTFWETYSGGKPKPTIETATPQVITALIEECTRLMFPGAEFVGISGE